MSSNFDFQDLRLRYDIALIVEDDINTAEYLQKVLEFWGCCAVVVHSGADAIQIAACLRPELVICDLELPDLAGCLVATTLRQNPRLDGVRLVALSGDGDDEHHHEALHAGFDSCLAKPITLEEFFEHLCDVSPSEMAIEFACSPV